MTKEPTFPPRGARKPPPPKHPPPPGSGARRVTRADSSDQEWKTYVLALHAATRDVLEEVFGEMPQGSHRKMRVAQLLKMYDEIRDAELGQ